MTMWLSVDPMADKYPCISPYAYCAWNPVKLVDSDGREIYLGGLSKELQKRLCDCLGYITGLTLSVGNGYLISNGTNGSNTYSQLAQEDLLRAINDKTKKVIVNIHDEDQAEKKGAEYTGRMFVSRYHKAKDDKTTFGLGIMFMHELQHAYFGKNDPEFGCTEFYEKDGLNGSELCARGPLGEAVNRVNEYRSELGLPKRLSYESYRWNDGENEAFRYYEGKVLFERFEYSKNIFGKIKKEIKTTWIAPY